MKARLYLWRTVAVVLFLIFGAGEGFAVDPNPLENAYWRFEEGTDGAAVPEGDDTVLDSVNANHMKWFLGVAPTYTSAVPAAVVPQTGEPNTLALDVTVGDTDLHAGGSKNISNPIVDEYTLEASFYLNSVGGSFQAIVGKDGHTDTGSPLPILALKVRGDNNLLQIEQFDGSLTARQVSSLAEIQPNQWYHAAAVNDGSTLSLYLHSGSGYELQGTDVIDKGGAAAGGALFHFPGTGSDAKPTSWTVGRGWYGGDYADWTDGLIDEVRLTNRALEPSEFLWVPEPASLVLMAAGAGMLLRRRRR